MKKFSIIFDYKQLIILLTINSCSYFVKHKKPSLNKNYTRKRMTPKNVYFSVFNFGIKFYAKW